MGRYLQLRSQNRKLVQIRKREVRGVRDCFIIQAAVITRDQSGTYSHEIASNTPTLSWILGGVGESGNVVPAASDHHEAVSRGNGREWREERAGRGREKFRNRENGVGPSCNARQPSLRSQVALSANLVGNGRGDDVKNALSILDDIHIAVLELGGNVLRGVNGVGRAEDNGGPR